MTRTTVVNIGKTANYDAYIGRGTRWGNPFFIGRDGSRVEVIEKYEAYVRASPGLMRLLCTLKGKVLACHCKPEACHGDVLARLADEADCPDEPTGLDRWL